MSIFEDVVNFFQSINPRGGRFELGKRYISGTPIVRPVRPSYSVRGDKLNWKRPTMRHTTARRGAGDTLTNHQRVLSNK